MENSRYCRDIMVRKECFTYQTLNSRTFLTQYYLHKLAAKPMHVKNSLMPYKNIITSFKLLMHIIQSELLIKFISLSTAYHYYQHLESDWFLLSRKFTTCRQQVGEWVQQIMVNAFGWIACLVRSNKFNDYALLRWYNLTCPRAAIK